MLVSGINNNNNKDKNNDNNMSSISLPDFDQISKLCLWDQQQQQQQQQIQTYLSNN